jgi:glutamine cyclotransferase
MPNSYIALNSLISFKLSKPDSLDVDSIVLYHGQNRVEKMRYANSFNADHLSTSCGKNYLQIKFYSQGKETQKEIFHYIVLAAQPANIITPTPLRKIPHNRSSYTQGLEFLEDLLYESNGTYGNSNVLTLSTSGTITGDKHPLPEQFFGEGLSIINNKVFQLTWRENTMFTYDLSLKHREQRSYPFESEGWGLTNDGKDLLMSDGSNVIYRLDPNTLGVLGQIEVYHDRGPQDMLNELELINGKLYANIYQSDKIAIIDTASGQIESFIDLAGLLPVTDREQGTDVLNGIAYHKSSDEVYITGKKWPWMYIFAANSLRDNVDN